MHSDAAALRKYGIWHEASRIRREEGLGAFWKGNLVTIVHRLPYSAISFYSYERYKNVCSVPFFVLINERFLTECLH
jgi:solute carrier family 25 (mitochondrial phosphate transporter), member 23/24/25/41